MRKSAIVIPFVLFGLNAVAVPVATGATCNVPAEYPLLENAVGDAACTEIVVESGYFAGGVLTLNIDRDLIIRGAGPAVTTLNYHMLVTNDAVLTLESLSIDGFGPPHGVELSSNAAGVVGNDLEIYGSLGWGIENTFGVNTGNTFAMLSDCAIFGNAGGVHVPALTMERCAVYGNNRHGGVAISRDSMILNSDIHTNQQAGMTDDGAGILFDGFNSSSLLLEGSNIYGNTTHIDAANATADGGGIMVRRGNVTFRNSDIYNNTAARRGAVAASPSTIPLTRV